MEAIREAAEWVIAKNVNERCNPIPARHLFAFLIRASRISNWDFANGASQLCNLGRYLNFESESARIELHLPDNIPPESFVARLDVSEGKFRGEIRQEGEAFVAKIEVRV